MKTLINMAIYLGGNAIGLVLAIFLLNGFRIDVSAFLLAVILFSVILAVLTPIIRSYSEKNAPALMGGLALLTVGAGLFITSLIMPGFQMGGFVNWIIATLLVWIGSVIATLILGHFFGPAPAKKK